MAELTAPAETYLLIDNTVGAMNDRIERVHARHLSGGNIAFADGHVKWMNKGAILAQPSLATPTSATWTTYAAPNRPVENCTANAASYS